MPSLPLTALNGLSVGLGNALQLVLLLDSIAVGGLLCSVDQLIGQAFRNSLDISESSLTGL